jgi:hypothetical protein
LEFDAATFDVGGSLKGVQILSIFFGFDKT